MGTGNIQADPYIAHAPGSGNMPKAGPYTGLYRLSSMLLTSQGSAANAPLSVAAGLEPDSIDLSGNFTSTDDYVVRYAENGQRQAAAARASGSRSIRPPCGAFSRRAMRTRRSSLRFNPSRACSFAARVTDDTGHFQYLPTCTGKAAGVTPVSGGGIASTAYVDLDTSSLPFLTSNTTKTNGGASGLGVGRLRVNPIQTVRWEIRPINTANAGDGVYAELVSPNADKYELFRTYADVTGVLTQAPELVAEYAVDLKFAFSADKSAITGTQTRVLTVYGFSDANNAAHRIRRHDERRSHTPQRIRSVHFRLTTRSVGRRPRRHVLDARSQRSARRLSDALLRSFFVHVRSSRLGASSFHHE